MEYRRLGASGLRVSVLSYGSWVTFDNQLKDDSALQCMQNAWDAGCNFFDNAEAYAGGESEAIMGRVIHELGWKRHHYVLSTKVFWGVDGRVPNMNNTLNRKYLHHSIEGCLERLQTDFVDLLFCHRADPSTPIEETVRAMSDLVDRGQVLYWGTSEWTADEIRAAWEIAERHHLHKPVMEQPQYNMLERRRVEVEYKRLYEDIGLGTTIWSPLASGVLTGKYQDGVPADSRGALPGYEWLADRLVNDVTRAKVARLLPIAERLGCRLAQLALAWCTKNPNVSTVITGASLAAQVTENFEALDVIPLLTPEVMDEIEAALKG
ncbi:MAG: potassium channel beta subunit family protein [Actinomycetota bacterium]